MAGFRPGMSGPMSQQLRKGSFSLGLLLLQFSFLPLGYILSLTDFTYGQGALDPGTSRSAIGPFFGWVAAGLLFERLARAGLYEKLALRFERWPAIVLHLLGLNILFAWPLYHWGSRADELGIAGFMFYENILQLLWTLLYLRTGSWAWTGLAHGLFTGFRFVGMNEISNPFETLYFYTAAHPAFYAVLFGVPLLTAVAVALFLHREKPIS